MPTLVVWAEDDRFFPVADGQWLVETIPAARPLVTLPRAKLFFPGEQPDRLIEHLRPFWVELGASAGDQAVRAQS